MKMKRVSKWYFSFLTDGNKSIPSFNRDDMGLGKVVKLSDNRGFPVSLIS